MAHKIIFGAARVSLFSRSNPLLLRGHSPRRSIFSPFSYHYSSNNNSGLEITPGSGDQSHVKLLNRLKEIIPGMKDLSDSSTLTVIKVLEEHFKTKAGAKQAETEQQPAKGAEGEKEPAANKEAEKEPAANKEAEKEPAANKEAEKEPAANKEAEKEPAANKEAEKEPAANKEAGEATAIDIIMNFFLKLPKNSVFVVFSNVSLAIGVFSLAAYGIYFMVRWVGLVPPSEGDVEFYYKMKELTKKKSFLEAREAMMTETHDEYFLYYTWRHCVDALLDLCSGHA